MVDTDQTLMTAAAGTAADAPAIGAPQRQPLSHGGLRALVQGVQHDLACCGVQPHHRVAIVLPNGPAMASCFLAVANACAAAPLNPAYRASEFEFYLSDLKPTALIVHRDLDTPAREIAGRLGIRNIELDEDPSREAGQFTLAYAAADTPGDARTSAADVALVLHTSGTTSRPKIVPLTHANLVASARHIGETLALSPAEHCLNVMPLFHIHGLVAGVLAPLLSGGRVSCTPGFNATSFFAWLDSVRPTWYTAVPTMHQVILDRAARNREIIERAPLRLIRSSSASLPAPVMQALEQTFGCPVIESYGMTEAAHQMTSNPLPPAVRKAGTVGLPAGPEVRIMNNAGQFIGVDVEGEVVIRGPNVASAYENNPAANATAFQTDADGGRWFRTGDLGIIDGDGYLRISGRIKEIINRGGEKIAPREVDDVLMEHAAVMQAVTFARAHAKLGEDVCAAVVLHPGTKVSERELRDFVGSHLASFKVPRTIHFMDEIPKGATGKLQRIGLAKLLGLQ